jgi:DNA-binding transcriptional MerR regulator
VRRPGERPVEPVAPDGGQSQMPTLKVAAVARRLGVAPATLRTWSRRYGLGPSAHVAGSHRQYTSGDVMRLVVMRRLTLEGVAPADAARVALDTPVDEGADAASGISALAGLPSLAGAPTTPMHDLVHQLSAAAVRMDSSACADMVRDAIAAHGVVPTWTQVLQPVLADAGRRFATTGNGIDIEHLLSTVVLGELVRATAIVPGEPAALLACAPHEDHWLPLHALAAALGEIGIGARVLGQAIPTRALAEAMRRTTPEVAVVLALREVPEDPLPMLRDASPGTCLFAAGPGWGNGHSDAGLLVSLPDAVAEVSRRLSGDRR